MSSSKAHHDYVVERMDTYGNSQRGAASPW